MRAQALFGGWKTLGCCSCGHQEGGRREGADSPGVSGPPASSEHRCRTLQTDREPACGVQAASGRKRRSDWLTKGTGTRDCLWSGFQAGEGGAAASSAALLTGRLCPLSPGAFKAVLLLFASLCAWYSGYLLAELIPDAHLSSAVYGIRRISEKPVLRGERGRAVTPESCRAF